MKITLTKKEYNSIAYALNELKIDMNTLLFPNDKRKEVLANHISTLEGVLVKYDKEQHKSEELAQIRKALRITTLPSEDVNRMARKVYNEKYKKGWL